MKRLLCLLTLLLPTVAFGMNGFAQIGIGAKSRGMGGVGVAVPQDAFIIAANPAGMVHLCDRLDAGIHWLRQNADLWACNEYSEGGTHYRSGRNQIWPEIGAIWRYCPTQALGVALYSFGGFETLYNPIIDGLGSTHTGMEYKLFPVSPAWAFRCGNHSFGVALNVTFAWTSIKGLEHLVGPDMQGHTSQTPTHATNRGTDHEEGLAIRVGWMYRMPCSLTAGISYQTPTWINRFKNYKGFIADRGDLDLPSQVAAGLSYCICGCVLASAEVVEWFWSDSAQFRHKYDPALEQPFGDVAASGFGWRDQTVYKAGLAVNLGRCATVRAGYNYGALPFDADEIFLNFIPGCFAEHHVTAGATAHLGCNELTVDFVYSPEVGITNTDMPDIRWTKERGHQYSFGAGYSRIF